MDPGDYDPPPQLPLVLPDLFARTLEIWRDFPLESQSVNVTDIMASGSCVFTFKDPSTTGTDNIEEGLTKRTEDDQFLEAERIVNHVELIVNVDFEDETSDDEDNGYTEKEDRNSQKDDKTSIKSGRTHSSSSTNKKRSSSSSIDWVKVLSVAIAIGAVGVALTYSTTHASSPSSWWKNISKGSWTEVLGGGVLLEEMAGEVLEWGN